METNITPESTDMEILTHTIGGVSIKDQTALTFIQWIAKKINGITARTPESNMLLARVQNPPFGQIDIEDKIKVIRAMMRIGIEIK